MATLKKNIGYSLLTYSSKILSGSVVFLILAKILSVNDFGLLSFGISLSGILTVFSEFGYSLMAQRDIPQNKFVLNKYVYNVFLHKLFFCFLALVFGFFYSYYFYNENNTIVGVLFTLNAVLTSFIMFLLSVFRSNNYFREETNSSIYYLFAILITLLIYFQFHLNVIGLSLGLLISRFIQLLILCKSYFIQYGIENFKYCKLIQNYLYKNSYSFGIHNIIGIFYLTIDSQLIAYYSGNKALALYQSIFNIVLILLSFTDLLGNVFLPFLAKLFSLDKNVFIEKSIVINKFIFVLGICMFICLNLFGEMILQFLFKDKYSEAFNIILPLSCVMVFRILSLVYAFALTISDNQNIRVLIVVVSLCVNLILNFIIVPRYGYVGAAYVSVLTHFILFGLYMLYFYKYFKSTLLKINYLLYFIFILALLIINQFVSSIIISVFVFILLLTFVFLMYSKLEFSKLIKIIS